MFEFKLPDLGEGIHEAEIIRWHVKAGDPIKEDAPLVEVETDKASVTIPSPRGGTVARVVGKPGDTVTVGQVIAVIDDGSGGTIADLPPEAKPAAAPATPIPSARSPGVAAAPAQRAAAPATRRLARELAIDLDQVPGTGPGGRITDEDVRRHASGSTPPVTAPTPSAPASSATTAIPLLTLEPLPDFSLEGPVDVQPLMSIRRKVARKMVTSSILVAHVAHMDEADVTELEAFRKAHAERHKGEGEPKLTLLAFVVKAVTAGLKAAPSFNASVDPFREEIITKRYINIGIAVDTAKGLVVPVVRETPCKSVLQIAADIEKVAGRARADRLAAADFRGGTFTITNIGPLGGTALIPIVNYPEVAILGLGKVQEKPVVREGQIVIRKMLPMTLSFDHRVADGADAARFVTELVRHLSDPSLLLLDT